MFLDVGEILDLGPGLYIVSYFFNVDFDMIFWQDLGAREDGLQLVATDCTFLQNETPNFRGR